MTKLHKDMSISELDNLDRHSMLSDEAQIVVDIIENGTSYDLLDLHNIDEIKAESYDQGFDEGENQGRDDIIKQIDRNMTDFLTEFGDRFNEDETERLIEMLAKDV